MEEKDILIQRIKKLLKHAESAKAIGSLKEAEMFMSKAIELMTKHNIERFTVESVEEKTGDEFRNYAYSERLSFADKHQGWQWKMRLLNVITDFNFTSYTFNTNSKTFTVYGNMENADITVWLYNFMSIALYNLAHDAYKVKHSYLKSLDAHTAYLFCKERSLSL